MNTDALTDLRNFAIDHNEIAFAHLVTTAIAGEDWAVDRVVDVLRRIDGAAEFRDADLDVSRLAGIRATDTTRPDGAIARGIEI